MQVVARCGLLGRWAAPRVFSGLSELGKSQICDVGSAADVGLIHGGQLLAGCLETDLEPFGFAEPAVELGLFDLVGQAVDDLDQPLPLPGVDPQHRAAYACPRCSMLRPEHSQRPRLVEIRDNLLDRIVEAGSEGWLGELEKLHTRLAGAEDKLSQLDDEAARQANVVDLGMPSFSQITVRTTADRP